MTAAPTAVGISTVVIPIASQEDPVLAGRKKGVDKRRVNEAVKAPELHTGLEFCVMVGQKVVDDPRREAERAFHRLGLDERPAVMVVVTPTGRTLELVTAPDLNTRVSDADCDEAVRLMTGLFAAGDITGGLVRGISYLADKAGPSVTDEPVTDDVPNVVDLDENS